MPRFVTVASQESDIVTVATDLYRRDGRIGGKWGFYQRMEEEGGRFRVNPVSIQVINTGNVRAAAQPLYSSRKVRALFILSGAKQMLFPLRRRRTGCEERYFRCFRWLVLLAIIIIIANASRRLSP